MPVLETLLCVCDPELFDLFSGMLLVGGLLGNVPGIDIARDINKDWGAACRYVGSHPFCI